MNKDDTGIKTHGTYSPFQELMNTHMRYIESLEYLRSDDFTHNPEKLLEKQIRCNISNMVKSQQYFQKSWSILSKSLAQGKTLLATSFPENAPKSAAEALSFAISDDFLGRISNSIFNPTYMALNPFELAQSFASDITTDKTSKTTTSKSRKKL